MTQISIRFTIAARTYELVSFLEEGEESVNGDTMVERANKHNANLGETEGQFILGHQDEIPEEFRSNFSLVFSAWRAPSHPRHVTCLHWNGDRWVPGRLWLAYPWSGGRRMLVRRVL